MAKKQSTPTPQAKFCYEIAWEVCNKVGGIYTVVSSKAQQMINQYGKENYFLIGPYFPEKAAGIFVDKTPSDKLKNVFEQLRKEGILCHYGEWLVKGNPHVILVDFINYGKHKDNIKKELWDAFRIDSLYTEWYDFDEPLVWSWTVGKLVEALHKVDNTPTIAHCHEWLAGGALLYLTRQKTKVGTVFTTHATMLGRTLATSNFDLYNKLKSINPEQEARNRGIIAKYHMEKQCAHNAGTFTTVSEITGIEAEHLLGKKPDVILPNGLDISKFPTFEETSIKHDLFKAKIKEFALYYFFPYYSFDIDNTLFFFLAGRYEYKDKGIDVFTQSLGQLNTILKKEGSKKTIIAFIWVPGPIKGIKPALLENKTLFDDVTDTINDNLLNIKNKIISTLLKRKELSTKTLFNTDTQSELTRKIGKLQKKGTPPLSTHDLNSEENDQILNGFRTAGLHNTPEDKVKVVYYPIYLTGADGLLNTSYYESMLGSHLGVFPSFYEPWGYTPLEAGMLGVGSITTDLAGFGRYICNECQQGDMPGIYVLQRLGKSDANVTKQLTQALLRFTKYTKHERIENKISARKVAETANWKAFIVHYITAHNKAIAKLLG